MAKARRPSNDSVTPYVGENLSALRQYNLTVAGTGWTTVFAYGVPYQTLDGTWRLRFNINGTITGQANTSTINISISGITLAAQFQAISIYDDAILTRTGVVGPVGRIANAGVAQALFSGVVNPNNGWCYSGDVALTAKPSFVP